MQRSGTEAIRTQIQPSKPKLEITNITNNQNTNRTYGQPSEQLFPKMWSLSNRNRTKTNMKTSPKLDTKNRRQKTTALERSVMNFLGGGLKLFFRAQPHPQFLKWYKTFSRLFSSHDNPLTRQWIITVNK